MSEIASQAGTSGPIPVRDVEELFALFGPRLERIVRAVVGAPEAVIEDACQSAWERLLDHASRVRHDCAIAWLTTTAYREAFRLADREQRESSLDELAEIHGGMHKVPLVDVRIGPEEIADCRDRIRAIELLPPRQRRFIWLHGAGYEREEIARSAGCTRRTVERQLLRGRARAASVHALGLA